MKTLLVAFLVFLYSRAYSDTLHIYLNTNTCKNCNLIGKQLERFPALYKILYLTDNDYYLADEILESYNFNPKAYEIKQVQNEFYNILGNPTKRSFCVLQRGKILKEFILGDMSELVNEIEPTNSRTKQLFLDEKIRLSNGAVVSTTKDYILFFDYKLGKSYVSFLRKDSVVVSDYQSIKDFNAEELLECNCLDKKLYNYLLPTLTELNLARPEFESCHLQNNTLNIMIGLNGWLRSQVTGDTLLIKRLFIFSKDLDGRFRSLNCINSDGNWETDNVLGSKFGVINFDFIKLGDTLYLPIITRDPIYKSLFVKQIIIETKAKSLGISKDLAGILPDNLKFTLDSDTANNFIFLSRSRNETDLFFTKLPLIYNINTKKTYFIKNQQLLETFKPKLSYISDAKIINNVAHFIIKDRNYWKMEQYDAKTSRLINTRSINVDNSINSILFMANSEQLLAYSSVENKLYIID